MSCTRIHHRHAEITHPRHSFGIIQMGRNHWEIISSKPALDGHVEASALRLVKWAARKLAA